MVRYLREQSLDAQTFATEYGREEEADPVQIEASLPPDEQNSNPSTDTALSGGKGTDAAAESDHSRASGFSPALSAPPRPRPVES